MIRAWMWDALRLLTDDVPKALRPAWKTLCSERSDDAIDAVFNAVWDHEHRTYVSATRRYARDGYGSMTTSDISAINNAAEIEGHARAVIDGAHDNETNTGAIVVIHAIGLARLSPEQQHALWRRIDPIGLLKRLVSIESNAGAPQ